MSRLGDLSRWMYRSDRSNRVTALLNRGFAIIGSAGLWPTRLVTLEVRGHLRQKPNSKTPCPEPTDHVDQGRTKHLDPHI